MCTKVRGQSFLGKADFVERLIGHLKKSKYIKEIPGQQMCIERPSLNSLFNARLLHQKPQGY